MSQEKNNRPSNMSQADYDALSAAGERYNNATTDTERVQAHADAEAIRNKYNYSGGADGSGYTQTNRTEEEARVQSYIDVSNVATQAGNSGLADAANQALHDATKPQQPVQQQVPQVQAPQAPDFTGLLDSWLASAKQQQELGIDYATQKGVNDLQRAEEDAQEQFQTQQNQVDENEAKALDNQALYAEARGDRGGIGQAQYGQIQAQAMQNRRAINTARTKLSTDTARAIADLRAQGEFKKADALLQLTQTYLGQLIDLQKWGAEYSLNVAQLNAQLQQWQAEFELESQKFTESLNQWDKEFNYAVSQDERNALAKSGAAALSVGVRPSAAQQAAMGYTDAQIDAELAAYKLALASGSGGGGGNPVKETAPSLVTNPYDYLYYYGVTDATTAAGMLQKQFGDYALDMADQYMEMLKTGAFEQPVSEDEKSLIETAAQALGIGPVSYTAVESLVESGKVVVSANSKGGYTVGWAPGYSAKNYNSTNQSTAGKLGTGVMWNDPLNLFS